MKNQHQLLLIIFLLTLFSCKKDKVPLHLLLPVPVYIPQELKDYMYFKPGTYWIYVNDSTGEEDSVYVSAAGGGIDTTYDLDGYIEGIWEWFSVTTKSSYDGYNYAYTTHTSWVPDGCDASWTRHCHFVFRIKTRPGDYVGQTIVFLYLPKVGTYTYFPGYPGNQVTILNIVDSLEVRNKIFHNVSVVNDEENITEKYDSTNFYIAKNYGIIKKMRLKSELSWSLGNYKIVQ